jgi:hypothetical protein
MYIYIYIYAYVGEYDTELPANKNKPKSRRFYDPDEEDDEYDSNYYLNEEGPTFDTGLYIFVYKYIKNMTVIII